MISEEEAEELHKAPKVIYEPIDLEYDGQKHRFEVPVHCRHRDDRLRLVGWANRRGYSFSLLYHNAIMIRRFGFHPGHENPDDEEISGPHKHEYREGYEDEWAYEVDDVTTNDLVQGIKDFCDEESIELESCSIQSTLGPIHE